MFFEHLIVIITFLLIVFFAIFFLKFLEYYKKYLEDKKIEENYKYLEEYDRRHGQLKDKIDQFGNKFYYKKDDKPAITSNDDIKEWYQKGIRHRD